jgi:tetratricopeptide (TPR) repeat protein
MSILNNFFGKKPADGSDQNEQQAPQQEEPNQVAAPAAPEAQQQAPQGAPADNKPEKIHAFDSFGREVLVPRDEWRKEFLEKGLKEVWDNADQLSFIIMKSLEDGFEADVIEAAKHLRDIDTNKERGWTFLGIVYMANNDLDNANKVLSDYVEQFGESSVVLTNLAKVCARRGESTVAMEMLWHALELDPNQDNAFMWYLSNSREKSPQALKESLNRIAALPNSWRARIWLAHDALEANDLDKALSLYNEALNMAPKPVPPDILQQISGELGQRGHLPEILRIVSPYYQPAVHGVMVGNNIIKAHLDLGQLDIAKSLVELLFSMKRPDWHKPLAFWDMEIAKARSELASVEINQSTPIELLAFDGPTWLRRDTPAITLSPAKGETPVVVALTSASFASPKAENSERKLQISNISGIIARALTIFMVEQVHFRTNALGRILQPWIANDNGGFALFGVPCEVNTACSLAKSSPLPAQFVAIPHIEEGEKVLTATIKLINVADETELGVITHEIDPRDLEPGFRALTEDFLKLVEEKASVQPVEAPGFYQVPAGPAFSNYQLRLEQSLIVSISASTPARSRSLHGERDIVDGMLQMCLANPLNGTLRLLLARILCDMRRIHPAVVEEYREKAELLEKTQPTPEPLRESVVVLMHMAQLRA